MVRDVFDTKAVAGLKGWMGVGHGGLLLSEFAREGDGTADVQYAAGDGSVRYPTAGSSAHSEAQPFYVNSPYGIVFAHVSLALSPSKYKPVLIWNNIAFRSSERKPDQHLGAPSVFGCRRTQAHQHGFGLGDVLEHSRQQPATDWQVPVSIDALGWVAMSKRVADRAGHGRINEEDVFTAIGDLMETCKGAYACLGMLAGFGLIGFRDPNGIRPLGVATRPSATKPSGKDYLLASESVVADALGFSDWQDVQPGEAIIITRTGFSKRTVAKPATFSPDIFEYVYFARPDSTMDGISVYRSRMAMGDALAKEARKVLTAKGLEIDVVIPVPDTSRVAALQLAQNMGIPYREGFIKNRYIGRTFIMPGQAVRRKNVRRKLNAMPLEFAGKNVMLVDGEYGSRNRPFSDNCI
jgi:amidophosphoribosyltransferase